MTESTQPLLPLGDAEVKELTVEDRPIDWFIPDAQELARHNDAEKTRLLGEDMRENGQMADVLATEDARLIAGHGRLLAARAVGIKTLRVKIYPATLNQTRFKLMRASENLQRQDLTGHQKFLLAYGLQSENSWSNSELSRHLHLEPSYVTKLLSPAKLTPAWIAALKEGTVVNIGDCYAVASNTSDPATQDALLAFKLQGNGGKPVSRDALEREAKKRKNGDKPVVRTDKKILLPLPSGVVIQVSGGDLDLADLGKALADVVKQISKGVEDGIDVIAFQSVLKAKAKAKGKPAK